MRKTSLFECITHYPSGNQYNAQHRWAELRSFFGIVQVYQCRKCGHLISKRQFNDGNYKLSDQNEHL